jgi:hypothetical protein
MPDPASTFLNRILCAADILRGSQRSRSTGGYLNPFWNRLSLADTGLWGKYDPLMWLRSPPSVTILKIFSWLRIWQVISRLLNQTRLCRDRLPRKGWLYPDSRYTEYRQPAPASRLIQCAGSSRVDVDLDLCPLLPSGERSGYTQAYLDHGELPHCPDCNGLLKPDVVLFGEQMPVRTWLKAQEACKV